jgi:hypothetical protein
MYFENGGESIMIRMSEESSTDLTVAKARGVAADLTAERLKDRKGRRYQFYAYLLTELSED